MGLVWAHLSRATAMFMWEEGQQCAGWWCEAKSAAREQQSHRQHRVACSKRTHRYIGLRCLVSAALLFPSFCWFPAVIYRIVCRTCWNGTQGMPSWRRLLYFFSKNYLNDLKRPGEGHSLRGLTKPCQMPMTIRSLWACGLRLLLCWCPLSAVFYAVLAKYQFSTARGCVRCA